MITREEALLKCQHMDTIFDKEKMEFIIHEIYDSIGADNENSKDPWNWVKTEYVALFKAKNPDKGGHIKESVARLKKMFAANPEIRKEDVILTTKYYLSQTDSRYIRLPHYFLKKGTGTSAIYEFDTWYEKYLEAKEAGQGRNNRVNTMQ